MPTAPNTDRVVTKKFIGAVKDEWRLYSNNSSDYTIGAPIGFGASSVVYSAQYHAEGEPHAIPCALKVLDLDRLPPRSLHLLQRETQLMSLSKHPNVLRVRGTWTEGHKLYIALRLMKSGSAADVMRYGWPGGMEEEVVKSILKQALEGLNYLHVNGLMHRDVKAANLLIDDDGTVLLADLGVAAFLWDSEDTATAHGPMAPSLSSVHSPKNIMNHRSVPASRQTASHHPHRPRVLGKRKSFVGTPCWMAPEVINGKQYDASADIWSFGITALELTQGRAPRSRESPHNVLLHIVQDAPPKLDRENGPYKYSRQFAEIVQQCLNKDPAARPTAEELLQSSFFKGAKKKGYLVHTILKDLPPLTQRQERRKQPSIITHRTIDSWDFSQSPTTSVYSHLPMHRITAMPAEDVAEASQPQDGNSESGNSSETPSENREHEEGAAAYAQRMRTRHNTTQHAPRPHLGPGRSVSWVSEAAKHNQGSASDRAGSGSSDNLREGGLAGKSEGPEMLSSGALESCDAPVSSKETDGVSVSPTPSAAHQIGAATTKPLDIPQDRERSAPIAGSPSSVASTSDSGPSEPSTQSSSAFPPTPSRLWRKLTGMTMSDDKEGLRQKAMNGMSELVKTVSRTRTASYSTSAKQPSEIKGRKP